MKTIAYSQVSQNPGYVHLAYLSAGTSGLLNDALFHTGMLMAGLSVLTLIVGSKFRLRAKAPQFWRLVVIAMVTATLALLAVALLTVPGKTRGMDFFGV